MRIRDRFFLPLSALLAVGLIQTYAEAQTKGPRIIDHAAQYSACMKLVQSDPLTALETGRNWQSLGGQEPARHCIALALTKTGQPQQGAEALEALASDAQTKFPDLVPDMLAQAGQVWFQLGRYDRAVAAQTAALARRKADPDLLIDRALSLAAAQNYWESIDDLNAALDVQPRRADALVYRATAYRYVDSLDLAETDLARALQLDPRHAPALLERGILRRLKGQDAAAREDWLAVLRLAPEGPAADMARANLEKMDVKPN